MGCTPPFVRRIWVSWEGRCELNWFFLRLLGPRPAIHGVRCTVRHGECVMGVGLPLVENIGGAQSNKGRPIPMPHSPRLTVQRTRCMASLKSNHLGAPSAVCDHRSATIGWHMVAFYCCVREHKAVTHGTAQPKPPLFRDTNGRMLVRRQCRPLTQI